MGSKTSATSYQFTNVADGEHTWTVEACDLFGNCTTATSTATVGTFRMDCTGPGVAQTASLQLYANHVPTYPSKHSSTPLDTGLDVVAGEKLTIAAQGELCFTDDASCDPILAKYGFCMGPQGNDNPIGTFSKFYQSYAYGRVVASIQGHEDQPIDVGPGATITAPFTGRLLMAANDNDDYNCPSKWDEVTIQRSGGFNLVFPSNGVASKEQRPTLVWSPAEDAGIGVHHVEVLINGAVAGTVPAGDTTFVVPEAFKLSDQDNLWQVRAIDELGNVGTSAVWTIRTDLTPPAPFTLKSPLAGEVVTTTTPNLCWNQTTDSRTSMAHYLLFVDDQYNTAQVPSLGCQSPKQALSQGEHCFRVVAQDELRWERTSGGADRCFIVDTLAPEPFALVSPDADATSYTARPLFCWETTTDGGTGVNHYEVWLAGTLLHTEPHPSPAPDVLCWQPTQPLVNGPYDWYVVAKDGAGLVTGTATRHITIERDVTPPLLTIDAPVSGELYGPQAGIPVTITAVDPSPGTGVANVSVFNPAEPLVEPDATNVPGTATWHITWPVTASGNLTICARSVDNEGNFTPSSGPNAVQCVTVLTDINPPQPFMLSAPTGDAWVGSRPQFTWQPAVDSPAGVKDYWLLVSGVAPILVGGQTTYELFPEEALADGNYTWTVEAVDSVGNASPSVNTGSFRVDGQAPQKVVLDTPPAGTWTNDPAKQLCWKAAADSGASGIASYRVRVGGETKLLPGLCATPALFEGDTTWDVAAIDLAGNVGPVSENRVIRVDLTPPPAPLPTFPDADAPMKVNPPSFHWQLVQDGPVGNASLVDHYVVTVGDTEAITAADQSKLTWAVPLTDGDVVWTVHAVDVAGNIGPKSAPRVLRLDTVAPGAVTITTPAGWTQNANPTITWTQAADQGTGVCAYRVSVDGTESVVAQTSHSLTLDDGMHQVAVRAEDCAQNLGPVATVAIGADTIPPVMQALPTTTCVAETPSLSWTACTDATSGPASITLLIDDSITAVLGPDETTWAAVAPLPEGPHTWAIRCTDAAGLSVTVESPLIVDATPPALAFTSAVADGGDFTISLMAEDTCVVGGVDVRVDGGAWAAATVNGDIWTVTLTLEDGTHMIEAQASDAVGLVTTASASIHVGPCWVPSECTDGLCSSPREEGSPCSDGDACTANDACDGEGTCAAVPVVCDDGNPCTDDACSPPTGCTATPNEFACDDGSACTAGDTCSLGACAGAVISCDDANPCTDDSCSPPVGCSHAANAAPCDDGSACTVADTCAVGECAGSPVLCDDGNACTDDICQTEIGCVFAPTSLPCDDGSACTTGDTCASGLCHGVEIACDDGDPCTDDICAPASGCVFASNSAPCDDGNACTAGDLCTNGVCQGTAFGCDDGNPCTDDGCDPSDGCTALPNEAPCDDGDTCTLGDACANGSCSGSPLSCADDDPCTVDGCDAGTCTHAELSGACDDGDACTVDDMCAGGSCTGSAASCDDDDACTTDACNPTDGCTHEATDGPCDDDDACTVDDTCGDGACTGTPLACDDTDACTVSACLPETGCAFAPVTCDDGDACTLDGCDPVNGCTSAPLGCDDGDACSVDGCDSLTGCTTSPVSCDDGDACTADACAPTTGCTHLAVGCDDGDACTADSCLKDGGCSHAPTSCDDGDACTADACDAATGCTHVPADCSDGDACTSDSCVPGAGCAHPATSCDDADACTTDTCDPAVGCVHSSVGCDDGDVCTTDSCDAKAGCTHAAVSCDDGNACTADSCHAATGCAHSELADCCTSSAECDAGASCVAGACLVVACTTCSDTMPCPAGECAAMQSGSFCVLPCEAGKCADGYTCDGSDGSSLCIPSEGDCQCDLLPAEHTCIDGLWTTTDGCGAVTSSVDCPRGCANAVGCCPVGQHAADADCVQDDATKPDPDEPDASSGGEDSGAVPTDDQDVAPSEGASGDDGCSGTHGAPAGLLWLFGLVALGARRRRRA